MLQRTRTGVYLAINANKVFGISLELNYSFLKESYCTHKKIIQQHSDGMLIRTSKSLGKYINRQGSENETQHCRLFADLPLS